jgi:hypothetical protein
MDHREGAEMRRERTNPGAAQVIIWNRAKATEAYQAGEAALVPAVLAQFDGPPTVPELRALGGFSTVIGAEIEKLAATMTEKIGSQLIPMTVGEVFSFFFSNTISDTANKVRQAWWDQQEEK